MLLSQALQADQTRKQVHMLLPLSAAERVRWEMLHHTLAAPREGSSQACVPPGLLVPDTAILPTLLLLKLLYNGVF